MSALLDAIANEFSDLSDPAQFARLIVRLLLAVALGFALGWQRETTGQAAGARTHMLVAMGSALFVLAAQGAGIGASDLSRVVQGLLTGIGFLCAGTIFRHGADSAGIHGLTTATGLWMTSAIGLACGLGRGLTAVVSTVLALVVLAVVPHFHKKQGHQVTRREE